MPSSTSVSSTYVVLLNMSAGNSPAAMRRPMATSSPTEFLTCDRPDSARAVRDHLSTTPLSVAARRRSGSHEARLHHPRIAQCRSFDTAQSSIEFWNSLGLENTNSEGVLCVVTKRSGPQMWL